MENKGAILILSGPSGCGKSTLLKEIYKNIENYYFSISTTTRSPRVGEKNGVDYYFVSKDEFEKDIEDGNFLEWAKVHDNYYGTSLKPIIEALNSGKLVIFDIDVQGHKIVRKKLNSCVTSVFITTPTLSVLKERLYSRDSDSSDIIEKRLLNAQEEINSFLEYDYLIINDDLQKSTKEILAIANIARAKTKLFDKDIVVNNWLK
ncbi:guanylate kinase [Arcobacter vandammei]|uniref:guanylate kinase n=1 Tax=Arcobacter vandammei TaxID=2782243 RepID=UPI0018DFF994|nr:guanylate kinase [Arcobacter vandammei]